MILVNGATRGVTLRVGGTGSLSAWRAVLRCTPYVRARSRIEGLSLPKWALRICSNNSTLVHLVMAQDFQPAGLAASLTDAGCQVGPNQVITVGPEQVITLTQAVNADVDELHKKIGRLEMERDFFASRPRVNGHPS